MIYNLKKITIQLYYERKRKKQMFVLISFRPTSVLFTGARIKCCLVTNIVFFLLIFTEKLNNIMKRRRKNKNSGILLVLCAKQIQIINIFSVISCSTSTRVIVLFFHSFCNILGKITPWGTPYKIFDALI